MDHFACNMTMTALGTALSASIGLNVVFGRKLIQQSGMLTKLAAASALLNEKLIDRLSIRTTPLRRSPLSDSCPTPKSPTGL